MSTTILTTDKSRLLKGYVLPGLVAVVPIVAAVIGAFLTTSNTTGLVGGVEELSARSTTLIGSLGTILPLGFAFVAGMVATVNPCGFAMLPAYLGLYLGSDEESAAQSSHLSRLTRALIVGSIVTSGFVLLFGVAGLILGAGARSIVSFIPWIGLGVGVVLTFAGAWMVSGGQFYTAVAGQAANRMGNPNSIGVRGYFLFGLSYGTASLGCTLPIFLAVIGTSIASGSLIGSVGQFIIYALGMGLVIMVLTLAIALFKGAMVGLLQKALPYIQPVSTGLMIIAGAYIVYYWLTIGGLLAELT